MLITFYSLSYILIMTTKRFTENKGASVLKDKMGFRENTRKIKPDEMDGVFCVKCHW
jgi:hypothetical protein